MSEKIFKILLEEFKRNGVKLIGHDFRCDVFISDPADIIHETFERQCTTIPQLLDFSEHDKVFEDKIENLEKQIKIYESHKKVLRNRCMESARDNFDKGVYGCLSIVSYPKEIENENKALKQRIVELEKELEEWKEEARVCKKQRDEQLKSFREGIEPYVDLLHMHETIAELKQYIDELKSKNESLNQSINEITTSRSKWIDTAVEWQKKCEKLKGERRDIEFYDNRHQSDCIEINRLNTTIDVLIHKVEYLRQFAGLE